MCTKCAFSHIHPDLLFKNHIQNINHYLDKPKEHPKATLLIKTLIDSLWSLITESTQRYHTLTTTERNITTHFRSIYDKIMLQEKRLKRQIQQEQERISKYINNKINELKELVKIRGVYKLLNPTSTKSSSRSDNEDGQSDLTGIDDPIETLTKSISECQNLENFIENNIKTLFQIDQNHIDRLLVQHKKEDRPNPSNIDELLEQHKNDSSSLLLDVILKYSEQFKPADSLNNDNNYNDQFVYRDFQLLLEQPNFDIFNSAIQQSIQVLLTTFPQSNTDITRKYIFATHQNEGATLIDTSNNNSIEEFKFDHCFKQTYSSIITIDEYIYVFGGYSHQTQWYRISIKDKTIAFGNMEDIDPGCAISVCYDGEDHIYLVNGFRTNRIDRFNIKTMQCQKYHQLPDQYHGQQVSSMIFKGKLYSIPFDKASIIEFNFANRNIVSHSIGIKPFTACHDNNGNFYIHSRDLELRVPNKFIKYNVETNETNNLNPIPARDGMNLIHSFKVNNITLPKTIEINLQLSAFN
ncbi:hypothetical protein PPL_08300 [Heterostelium album PN500]|uniref:Uncharacterized protein n=1 Tax=Heterostelium pallidum (strain ATCC 26659 / Pp 5 / PN500) TaxID=670386 RepID=D3BHT6_HETP5|nr:hypothetical protein PPL_08300 [Heterostelium album PN500]EFA78836.1 hypothetical protein PPL_08300 [Heterostelium album PN500]|eukprot:XP_020430960.1 hypothetical protein PPL_08300 [Heterostelium album PN500]